jgi:hypothetical protein
MPGGTMKSHRVFPVISILLSIIALTAVVPYSSIAEAVGANLLGQGLAQIEVQMPRMPAFDAVFLSDLPSIMPNPIPQASGGFETKTELPAPTYLSADWIKLHKLYGPYVYTGDFNNDGIPDVALSDGHGVSVLLGNGDGTFHRSFHYYPKTEVGALSDVVIADFNNDGNMDIAFCSDAENGRIAILLGNGDGTFQHRKLTPSLSYPYQMVVEDFNNDGNKDLAVWMVNGSQEIAVLNGRGDGTFTAPNFLRSHVHSDVSGLAIGDFNGDGYPDLLVQYSYMQAVIFVSDGTGGFSVGNAFTDIGSDPVVGDFNRDGTLDFADVVFTNSEAAVEVFIRNGDGTGQTPVEYPVARSQIGSLATADLTGNGILDLVMGSQVGIFSVLKGKGDGTFLPPSSNYAAGSNPSGFALADFNGDGRVDAIFGQFYNYALVLTLGNGDGTFQAARAFPATSPQASPVGMVLADFNNDGNLDEANVTQDEFGAASVTVALGNGDGTFQAPLPPFSPGSYIAVTIVVGDFNSDGNQDLAVLDQGSPQHPAHVLLFWGNGDGTFRSGGSVNAGTNPGYLLTGDFNHDGNIDFAIGGCASSDNCVDSGITILLGDGLGNFTPLSTQNIGPYFIRSLLVADLNGDGISDIGMAEMYGEVDDYLGVMLGNGDGTFGTQTLYSVNTYNPLGILNVVAGDFNGDGIPDLVIGGQSNVELFPGIGNGMFGNGKISYGSCQYSPMAMDANGDGNLDLICPNPDIDYGPVAVNFLLGSGDGKFNGFASLPSAGGSIIVRAGDLNGDGLPDLAVLGASSPFGPSYLTTLLNTRAGVLRQSDH